MGGYWGARGGGGGRGSLRGEAIGGGGERRGIRWTWRGGTASAGGTRLAGSHGSCRTMALRRRAANAVANEGDAAAAMGSKGGLAPTDTVPPHQVNLIPRLKPLETIKNLAAQLKSPKITN